ncbi:MAG: DUF4874 domain-containing protein [Lachnospiraceae bacterium]|nr:DUF4874 domain-containing protein [Lachnospiraceae bacterium]
MKISSLLSKFTNSDNGLVVPKETTEELMNPDRGWYKMFTFEVGDEPDFKGLVPLLIGKETLVLLFFNIGKCKERLISDDELSGMRKIVNFFRSQKKDVILRVAYDNDGNAFDCEPSTFSTCLEHISQIGGLVKDCGSDCFIFQGALIGNWGEMHSSRYSSTDRMKKLVAALEKTAGTNTYLAVRKPVMWRELRAMGDVLKTEKLGVFNDGMFGSVTDLGTYSQDECPTSEWTVPWSRKVELEFQDKLSAVVPSGGEAVFGDGYVNTVPLDYFLTDLSMMHTTYLNRQYDTKLLDIWRDKFIKSSGLWNGKSFFEYIGAHLGYRFVIESVDIKKSGKGGLRSDNDLYSSIGSFVEFTVRNDGFAPMYRQADLYITLGGEMHTVYGALNTIPAGETKVISSSFRAKEGELSIYARRNYDDTPVFFANESDSDGRIVFGNVKGQ